jgi:hypothetical protein
VLKKGTALFLKKPLKFPVFTAGFFIYSELPAWLRLIEKLLFLSQKHFWKRQRKPAIWVK